MRRRNVAVATAVAVALTAGVTTPAHAQAPTLRAGVGRADITPPTGFPMMGWVRSDARLTGQHTRLFARAIVLQQGDKKLALVTEDLNGIPGGMLVDAAKLVADRGFTEQNVLDSASHTHAGPGGFYNFPEYNFLAPTQGTLTDFNLPSPPDTQLYGFEVKQLAEAIRRADDDLAPAQLGWGETKLVGLTANRSIEAHLADHGILKPFGEGSVSDDPLGYEDTIDPEVNVLRVDKIGARGRHVPVGIWSTFADHGTVNKYTFHYYNADHHGSATRVAEDAIRASGKTPASQDVVAAYGNTDEGDISAGLTRSGPEEADEVGRVEADAFMKAWNEAGTRMSGSPIFDYRWTRVCFCGQPTDGGNVADRAVLGLPQVTGSEEGRGPLYDITKTAFEGQRNPADLGGNQGHKLLETADTSGHDLPKAVPLMAVRLGDRMIVSVPGEMTEEMGRRLRDAVVKATSGNGITRAIISGLANEYLSYFTTPEEYDRQHYEGGSTLYGPLSAVFLQSNLAALAGDVVQNKPAPDPYPFDPVNGVQANLSPYDPGASSGSAVAQPGDVRRLDQVHFSWKGGEKGLDRPLDRPFVRLELHGSGNHWTDVDDDLGLDVLWLVDGDTYQATWEVPIDAPRGEYRFHITANRYEVTSDPFKVAARTDLTLKPTTGRGNRPGVFVTYPPNEGLSIDAPPRDPGALQGDGKQLAWHPTQPNGGSVTFVVGGKKVRVRRNRGAGWSVKAPRGKGVEIPKFGVHDAYGNTNGDALRLR